MYGTSLVVMAGVMKNPALRTKPSMLVASALLGIFELSYEYSIGTVEIAHQAWIAHTAGNAALILSREPQEYKKGYSHMLFSDLRIVQAFYGMRLCKPCPFAAQEWKTVPFEDIPKSPKDVIADITLELPELYSDIKNATECLEGEEQLALLETIASKSWLLDFRLRTWAATTGLQIREFVKSKIAAGSSTTAMSSEQYALANVSLLYWITCISLYDILEMTGDTFESPWPEHANPLIYCRELTVFIPFLLAPQAGCPVTNFVFFALDSAAVNSRHFDYKRKKATHDYQLALVQSHRNGNP
ncbi:unnamed protein product [Clonostachys rosea]|uniref:Transcription factor domain-containing protein n=1 Tax=Bionectria ochroleuca TaxID=29856 RepID=A0ABY6UEC0_BIOOC|nr:unnamed protein product [Clonostachys rosea]